MEKINLIEANKICKLLRNKKTYSDWKTKIIQRDCSICCDCEIKSDGQVHHLKSLLQIILENNLNLEEALSNKLIWDEGNAIFLCCDCHYLRHTNNKKLDRQDSQENTPL